MHLSLAHERIATQNADAADRVLASQDQPLEVQAQGEDEHGAVDLEGQDSEYEFVSKELDTDATEPVECNSQEVEGQRQEIQIPQDGPPEHARVASELRIRVQFRHKMDDVVRS